MTTTEARERRHSDTNRLLRGRRWLRPGGAPPADRRGGAAQPRGRAQDRRRFRNRGVPDDDLDQVASLALVRAAQRFDPDKADDFLTFAVPTIRGELKRYFRDQPGACGRRGGSRRCRPHCCRRGWTSAWTPRELAARLDLPVEDVREALGARGCFPPSHWTRRCRAAAREHARPAPGDEDGLDAMEARLILRTLTLELQPRERLILYLRFVEDRTQQEIGDEIGVTQMQVSRLLAGILDRMRARLTDKPAQVA